MKAYKIEEETKNKILLHTPMSLPDRPGERGMKAEDVKAFFYKYITLLINAINNVLEDVSSGVTSELESHNQARGAHAYLLELIKNLQYKDSELGNSIKTQITSHNVSSEAHGDIRELIGALDNLAKDAYNLASGKSKVHPYTDLTALLADIDSEQLTLNAGDIVIFKDENTPDIAVFTTGQETRPEDDEEISAGSILEEKKSYYYDGITFIALETGIDTSLLAEASEVEEIRIKLEGKEESIKRVESTETKLELTSHTEYNLGLITELMISLPENTDGLEAIINFRCGATAPSFDAPSDVFFQGDDTLDGRLYPVTKRLYEINIKKVLGVIIAKVGAMDYEVIE